MSVKYNGKIYDKDHILHLDDEYRNLSTGQAPGDFLYICKDFPNYYLAKIRGGMFGLINTNIPVNESEDKETDGTDESDVEQCEHG